MQKLNSVLLLLLFSFLAHAEQSYQAPLVKESLLLDVAANDIAVAVGERGHVLIKSSADFEQVIVPTTTTLTAVTLVEQNIWAVGHDATILHSSDAGDSWQIQMSAPEMERPFLDVLFFDNQHGIAIGAYGLFYRTLDGGASWTAERHAEFLDPYDREYLEQIRQEDEEFYQQELNSILPHLNRVKRLDENTLLLAGEAGLLAISIDKGNTWERMDVNYTGSFFDVAQLESGIMVAAGLRGNVFVSEDSEQWEYVKTCNTATINSIITQRDAVYFIGNNGTKVKATLPMTTSTYDPYAAPVTCEPATGISVSQTESKSALLNAAMVNGQLVVTAADGIYSLSLD